LQAATRACGLAHRHPLLACVRPNALATSIVACGDAATPKPFVFLENYLRQFVV